MQQSVKGMLSRIVLAVGLLWSSVLIAESTPQPVTLNVAVAANFAKPLAELARDYETKSGNTVRITVGSSGALFAQIVHGAPFDVFLSADAKRPDALVEQGLAHAEDAVIYAQGRLAVAGANENGLNALRDATDATRIAIADPRLAPYGSAAQQALTAMGLWSQLSANLIRGSNIQQTLQFWQTGNVQLAIVAASQCIAYQLNCTLIDAGLHQPIIQKLVVVSRSAQVSAAREFASFMVSDDVQQQLTALGYLPLTASAGKS